MAVYRFARLVDDIGDEAGPLLAGERAAVGSVDAAARRIRRIPGQADPATDRLRALDAVEDDLDRAFSAAAPGRHRPSAPLCPAPRPRHLAGARQPPPGSAVVREVARTAAECVIPAEPFRMLIEANRQDQTVSRYATFDDLLGYCRLSANPVGRIVLHIFGAATAERERLSDLVCTALQLAEHWQDVAEDFARGRIYLPQEDWWRSAARKAIWSSPPPASATTPLSGVSTQADAIRDRACGAAARRGRSLSPGPCTAGRGWPWPVTWQAAGRRSPRSPRPGRRCWLPPPTPARPVSTY